MLEMLVSSLGVVVLGSSSEVLLFSVVVELEIVDELSVVVEGGSMELSVVGLVGIAVLGEASEEVLSVVVPSVVPELLQLTL